MSADSCWHRQLDVNESFCDDGNRWRASPVGSAGASEALPVSALAARGRATWALLSKPGGSS